MSRTPRRVQRTVKGARTLVAAKRRWGEIWGNLIRRRWLCSFEFTTLSLRLSTIPAVFWYTWETFRKDNLVAALRSYATFVNAAVYLTMIAERCSLCIRNVDVLVTFDYYDFQNLPLKLLYTYFSTLGFHGWRELSRIVLKLVKKWGLNVEWHYNVTSQARKMSRSARSEPKASQKVGR